MIWKSAEDGKRCSRLWEVDAARDGRLALDEREQARRHQNDCDACRERVAYLEGLGEALRGLGEPRVDPKRLRDLREALLRRAEPDLARRSPHGTFGPRGRWIVATLTSVIVACVVARTVIPTRAVRVSAVPGTAPATKVEAVGGQGTRWIQHTEGEVERIELSEGTLHLRVERAENGRRVVIHVPDGEIEDDGTVFRVVVGGGHTQQVDVDEGRVTLRLEGMPVFSLSARATWSRDQSARATSSASAEPLRPRARAAPLPPVVASSIPPIASSTKLPPVPPSNAADEDASYLRAIQLLRDGRTGDAKREAKDYLRRFPDGFRREEMGKVAE